MSWSTKVCFFAVPLSLAVTAFGQRFEFNPRGERASVESHLLSRGTEVSAIEITLNVPFVDVEKTRDGFESIGVKGLIPTAQPGFPELATTGQLISVPQGYEAKISVIEEKQSEIPNVWVQPVQNKFRCETGRAQTFAFNSALYQSGSVFPAENVKLENLGKMQNLKLMRVALNPVQMDFAHKSLKVTTQLRARVDFVKSARAENTTTVLPNSLYSVVRLSTANGQGLGNAVRAAQGPETMLILVADEFKQEISPLVTWKQQRGYNVEVFTLTEAGGTKESVKKFIQEYYNSHSVKPSFLITVGNKTSMPTYMESTSSGSAASDWQYSLLSGNNSNIPDLFYGRLVADNAEELKTQMNRWIAYEKNPERGAAWYHDAMTIASPDGSGPSDQEYAEQIQEILKANNYKNIDSFFAAKEAATAANITAATLQGRSWIAYFGHGSGTSWASTNDTFSNTEVGQLENSDKLPFMIDVACQNASWVKLPKCFGKAWVTQKTQDGKAAGAVAFYGGSVNISWHPPAVMSVGVAKSHFEKGIPTLGGSVIAGQLYLFEKMGQTDQTLDNLKWYNLLGDPSLNMRTNTPVEYQIKKSLNRVGDNTTLNLTATDTSGKGLVGLTVSVTSAQRGTIAVGKTGQNGTATLSIPSVAALGNDSLVTVSGYNAETVQVAVSE
jgi:Peptidase family C25/Propeptide_C25